MKATFGQIYTEVLTAMGITESSADSTVLDSIKLRINQVQDWVFYHRAWEFRQKKFYLTTWAPYSTGTISVTNNSATVIGSGTTWVDKYKMGYLVIGSKSYKVRAIGSTTTLTLMAPFDGTTASAQTYKIVFPDYILNHEISAIKSIKINNVELDLKKRDSLTFSIGAVSEPWECAIGERTWNDFYNTGTMSVTNASTTMTISSGTTPEEIVGMPVLIKEFSKEYTITSRTSATTFELEEAYQGATGSGKSYTIGGKGSQLISFRNSPDATYFVEIEALVKSSKLVDSTDYSMIPDHAVLLHGAIWLGLTDRDGQNPVRIQQARADFEKALVQMEHAHTSNSNLRWTSNSEIVNRKNALSNFNPLRDRYDTI